VSATPSLTLTLMRPRILPGSDGATWPGVTVRRPESLTPSEAAQLVAACGRGSDLAFAVEELFAHGTTRAVAQAIQFGSAWELLAPEFSLDSYAAAHTAAAAAWPRSNLAAFYPPTPDDQR